MNSGADLGFAGANTGNSMSEAGGLGAQPPRRYWVFNFA